MKMSIRMEVWGEYACFSRPELKSERVSYDIMTPSAARGILEAVFWHPGLRWHIDKIYVLNPIRFTNIRRNEVKSVVKGQNVLAVMNGKKKDLFIAASQDIQQRAALVLQDVHYVIEAHFTMTEKAAPGDNAGKFQNMIKRRLDKGQCYHQPYLGTREFPAAFKRFEQAEVEVDPGLSGEIDLGYMLYDMDFSDLSNIQPMFFRAILKNGVVDLQNCEVRK